MTVAANELTTWTTVEQYRTYAEAERAVDSLSDQKFPVGKLAIVGCDLRLVERVLSRQTWLSAAASGLGVGAWFGLLIGLLFAIFAVTGSGALALLLGGVFWGALFGLVFGLAAHAVTGGRRDFVSRSSVVADRYELLASSDVAERACEALASLR